MGIKQARETKSLELRWEDSTAGCSDWHRDGTESKRLHRFKKDKNVYGKEKRYCLNTVAH